jgi:Sec7-like guanine-nucleotide exchange factor
MFYQIHEKHGRHMAGTLTEAEANEKNGWKTVTEQEFYGQTSETTLENVPHETLEESNEDVPRSVLEDAYEMKFGEKPHHRMKNETIKAKLES